MDVETVVFDGELVRVGLFRCQPSYTRFENAGPIQGYLLVFPRTSVYITHAGGEPILADPNVVMFYNPNQVYRRRKLSERGDLCDWFAFAPHVIVDALRTYDPRVADHPDRPFGFTHGPSESRIYLLQRLVVEHLVNADRSDSLFVEETMLCVLGRAIENACRARGTSCAGSARRTPRAHAELVHDVRTLLAARFRERLSLADIAQAVYASPYHVCRVFRQQAGNSIHRYLNELRLRTALEYAAQRDTDLTELGLELGYSSHSHFTQAFKRAFGISPSTLRRSPSSRLVRDLSKNLIA